MSRFMRTIVIAAEVVLVLVIATRWGAAESSTAEPNTGQPRTTEPTAADASVADPTDVNAEATGADAGGADPSAADATATTGAAPEPTRVLLAGDSIMRQTGPALEGLFGPGVTVANEAVNGSGLLTPGQVDWVARLQQLVVDDDPDVVVVLFIGNYTDTDYWIADDGQPVMQDSLAFFSLWAAQADRVMEVLESSDADVYWVLPPPEFTPQNAEITTGLRQVYTELAGRWPRIHLIDANDALAGPSGEYLDSVTGPGGEVVPLRAPDTVHLTDAGASRLADTIHGAIDANP